MIQTRDSHIFCPTLQSFMFNIFLQWISLLHYGSWYWSPIVYPTLSFFHFFFFFSQIFLRLLDILRVAKLTWLFVMVLLMVKQWFSFFFFNGPVLFFALLYAVLFCSNWSSWHGWICSVPAYTSGKSWFLIDHPMSFLGTTSYSE